MSEMAMVLDRLGGIRGLVDGAVPPLLFAATNTAAAALGHGNRATLFALGARRRLRSGSWHPSPDPGRPTRWRAPWATHARGLGRSGSVDWPGP